MGNFYKIKNKKGRVGLSGVLKLRMVTKKGRESIWIQTIILDKPSSTNESFEAPVVFKIKMARQVL